MNENKVLIISPKNRTIYNFRAGLIQELQTRGYEVFVTGPDHCEIEKVNALGVKFILIPMKKNGLNIVEDVQYFFALIKQIKLIKPDIVFGYTIKPVIYGSIAAKLGKVPNISMMITGLGYVFVGKDIKARLLRFLIHPLYRLGLYSTDNVIFQNPDDLCQFLEFGLVKTKQCKLVNGSGVDLGKFSFTDKFPEAITFFMLARIVKSKGVIEYLESARIIKSKYPDVKFILLGSLEKLPDSISEDLLNIYIRDKVISFHGESDKISDYYRACSVFVLPSYREGTPRTVLEAMATGRPIITTETPGCRETVINGYNGFLVPIQDIAALTSKMEWFVKNPEKLSVMGRNSYELCKEKFDVDKVNLEMIKSFGIEERM